MKRKIHGYVLLSFLAILTGIHAQIPNQGFESWRTAGNCDEPLLWYTTNLFDSSGSYCPVSKSTDHFPADVGSYSIRIANNTSLLPQFSGMGVALSTRLDGSDRPLFPISGHPTSLTGYYKFTSENNDTMTINVALYNNSTEIISGRLVTSQSTNGWTSFNISIPSYTSADSARISLLACNVEGAGALGNSVLYVDNLNFDSLITSANFNITSKPEVTFYPNPMTDIVHIRVSDPIKSISLKMVDLNGTYIPIRWSRSPEGFELMRPEVKGGVYILELTNPGGEILNRVQVLLN